MSAADKPKKDQSKTIGSVIAKAWDDQVFKERLLKDPKNVLQEEGVVIPAGIEVQALEDTDTLAHFVIPAKPANRNLAEQGPPPGCECWQGEAWR